MPKGDGRVPLPAHLPPGYYTLRQAATELGITEQTLRYRISRGYVRLETVHVAVELLPVAELERLRHTTFSRSRPGKEPSPTEDYPAFVAWNKKHKKYLGLGT